MSRVRGLITAAVALAAVTALAAAPLKLATQAPTGSMWHKALLDMGAAWSKNTTGRVTVDVFPDGKAGDEGTTIRKMRGEIATYQAALLTAGGLSDIDPAFNVFAMPFFFETDDEELAVQHRLEPLLEQALQAKGYHLLAWGTGGWVQLFSKKPLKDLASVKSTKLYVSKSDEAMTQWYTKNGFNPQPLLLADIGPQLKLPTGMIDTTPDTPYLALTMQIYANAKFMLDVHISPLVGALIVSNTAWNRISPEDRAEMTKAARVMETQIRTAAPKQDADSVTAMVAHGLQVTKPDPKAMAEFRTAADNLVKTMSGTMVPENVFKAALDERDAFRKSKGPKDR